jgi:hypothetical protein
LECGFGSLWQFLSMKLSTMNPEVGVDARYHQTAAAATAMLVAPPHHHQQLDAAVAFPSYAATAHPQQVDSCAAGSSFHPGTGGWEAQDLQSVIARHNHAAAAVHGHDLSYALPTSPATAAHNNNFTGK